jgi:uncharacterized protein DUF6889
MIPVRANPPMCRLIELRDGTYDLADVAFMVDVLKVERDNMAIGDEIRRAEAEAATREARRRRGR